MPALDFTTFPSKPTAPPAGSSGAPRPTARAGAPAAGPKTGPKAGSPKEAGEFGQLVDRLADAPDEGQVSSRGAMARRSRDPGVISEESAAEPRAKGDADEASGTANDAPAAVASMASNPAPFPWTLPLSPSLWLIERVKDPADNAGGDTWHGEEGEGVTSAITESIATVTTGACLATLPGAETSGQTAFKVPVDAPIAIDPATTFDAASTTPAAGTQIAQDASDASSSIETAAWTGPAAASAVAVDTAADANATGAGDDLLAINGLAGAAALVNAAAATGQFGSGDATIGQPAVDALANNPLASRSSITSTDSTRLAPSAMDSATTAAAVGDTGATTAAAPNGQANAALDAPLPGDSAREQALIELQRALESVSAHVSASAKPQARNADATTVIQTGASAAAATGDAAAAANATAIAASANAVDGSSAIGTPVGESGADSAIASMSAPGRTSRSRDARQISEELDTDSPLTGASSWAAAAAAKYAEVASAGTPGGGDTPDSGSNADAAASIALPGRAADAGSLAPHAFDARVHAASRAGDAPELADGPGEPAILTTAPPDEQGAQIVRSMRLQWRGANGEAMLRLQPDHLGHVFVSVKVEQGTVFATVRAETPAAQQWIQQHQQQLRDALDAQGLRVAQFHVTSNPDDRPRRDQEQDQQQDATGRRPRSRPRTDDDRRFEIHL